MFNDIFQALGLSKNEGKIYETLIREGESPVVVIATKSQINRRNVYDSINRLIEKGLIFEIRQKGENLYQAIEPRKLMELLKEKEALLEKALPELEKLYQTTSRPDSVHMYRGVEGWKNYMRDILRIGKDVYTIGGKGAWIDPTIENFFEKFTKDAEGRGIGFHVLFDNEVKEDGHAILKTIETNHKFLPAGFSTSSAIEVFGDHVVIFPMDTKLTENLSIIVLVNQPLADSFRTWFNLLWQSASKIKKVGMRGNTKHVACSM